MLLACAPQACSVAPPSVLANVTSMQSLRAGRAARQRVRAETDQRQHHAREHDGDDRLLATAPAQRLGQPLGLVLMIIVSARDYCAAGGASGASDPARALRAGRRAPPS